jgi:hypothetical protein
LALVVLTMWLHRSTRSVSVLVAAVLVAAVLVAAVPVLAAGGAAVGDARLETPSRVRLA